MKSELESVKRKLTRLIDGIGLMLRHRLSSLKLTTVIEHRARGDLIEVFKIFRGSIWKEHVQISPKRNEHSLKLKNMEL